MIKFNFLIIILIINFKGYNLKNITPFNLELFDNKFSTYIWNSKCENPCNLTIWENGNLFLNRSFKFVTDDFQNWKYHSEHIPNCAFDKNNNYTWYIFCPNSCNPPSMSNLNIETMVQLNASHNSQNLNIEYIAWKKYFLINIPNSSQIQNNDCLYFKIHGFAWCIYKSVKLYDINENNFKCNINDIHNIYYSPVLIRRNANYLTSEMTTSCSKNNQNDPLQLKSGNKYILEIIRQGNKFESKDEWSNTDNLILDVNIQYNIQSQSQIIMDYINIPFIIALVISSIIIIGLGFIIFISYCKGIKKNKYYITIPEIA